jgi:tetratricopeptide (TPR) repeat protein
MTDDIRAMTAQLAQDPGSLVFLPLAEALRRRGQLDAALIVAERGATRYPELADAHDVLARIRADRGEGDSAFDAWTAALRVAPDHLGAHKGLAFLFYRAGDVHRSLKHLTRALELAPQDGSLAAAVERIRSVVAAEEPEPDETEAPVPSGVPAGGSLLFDAQGRVLRGRAPAPDGTDVGAAVAAVLAGVSREAGRMAKLLSLGDWRAVAIEGGPANYELRAPTPETVLLVYRPREVPAGQLSRIAERAAGQARQWLDALE